MGKAERVIAVAQATSPPWEVDLVAGDAASETLHLARGDETMTIKWVNGGLEHPLTYSLSGVKEVKLRNVSAALKVIEGKPDYTKRTAAPRQERSSAPREIAKVALPFDIETATDSDIIKAVRGKQIVWLNEMAGEYERASVPPRKLVEVKDASAPGGVKKVWRTSRNISVSKTSAGRRVLTFPAVGEQYRSVGLDSIVQIR